MSISKKIIITLLVLAVVFILFKVAEPTQAQYGFSRLRGVGGLEQASIGEIIVRVISWVMAIIGLICVVFIIYGGVMYATSGGSEEHITRGKKILLWAIVGLVISILAFTIANAVVGAIGGEGGAAGPGADKWCAKWDNVSTGHKLRKEFTSASSCESWRSNYPQYTCVGGGCGFSGTFGNCTVCNANDTGCGQVGEACGKPVADCFEYGPAHRACLK